MISLPGVTVRISIAGPVPTLAMFSGAVGRVTSPTCVSADGVLEAKAFDGDRFGQTRVEALIRARRKDSAEKILFTIRDELERFLAGSMPDDDQTGIIVKRR